MNETTKIKFVAAVLVAAALIAATGWAMSELRVMRAEQRIADARAETAAAEREAAARKLEAAEYKQLSDSLEKRIAAIRSANEKLDEKLKDTNANYRAARADVERARRRGTVAADDGPETVCEKLERLGHPC